MFIPKRIMPGREREKERKKKRRGWGSHRYTHMHAYVDTKRSYESETIRFIFRIIRDKDCASPVCALERSTCNTIGPGAYV